MICERCQGSGRRHQGGTVAPCPGCLGMGTVSCCDGPAGYGDELPNDPLGGGACRPGSAPATKAPDGGGQESS